MRPVYESTVDRDEQSRALGHVCRAWRGVTAFEFPPLACADWMLHNSNSKTFALAELKGRTCARDSYATVILSKKKLDRALATADALRVSFILFVEWNEGMFWLRIADASKFRVARGGRSDRDDPADIEDVYHIPVKDFRKLEMKEVTP